MTENVQSHAEAANRVAARYFDTLCSRAHPVTLHVAGGELELLDPDGALRRRATLQMLRVSERIHRGPRLVTFEDGAYCEITDHASFDTILAAAGHRDALVSRLQCSWRAVIMSLVVLCMCLAISYRYLLPAAAATVAKVIPPSLEAKLGAAVLASLDQTLVGPTNLPAADQQRIRDRFVALRQPEDRGHDYSIQFRNGRKIGANAMALPGGIIIVTDELVELIGTGPVMLSVLAHEAGHVAEQHGLQRILQVSVLGMMTAYLFNDISTLLAVVPATLLTMRYSRDHERSADAFAVRVMRDNRLPPAALADALEKLQEIRARGKDKEADGGEEEETAAGFFSTHPLTRERIEAIRGGGG